jgi:hypothetical protein
VAPIPCVHIISSDVSKPHHFRTSGFRRFYTCIPQISRTYLAFGVHIVQLSTFKVVAHGMSRKGPHNPRWRHHAAPLWLFDFRTSGFRASGYSTLAHSNSPECRTPKQADLLTHASFDELFVLNPDFGSFHYSTLQFSQSVELLNKKIYWHVSLFMNGLD